MTNPDAATRTRLGVRVAAIVQLIFAALALLILVALLVDRTTLGGDGILEGMRLPFIVTSVLNCTLFALGGVRAWRGAHRWWLLPLAAVILGPVLFIVLLAL